MGELDWEANPGPQKGFLMCPVREVLYGGAKGGGKSEAIGPLVVKHVITYGEHAVVLVLRQDTKQLRDLMRRMRKHCLRAGGRYSKSEKTWYFPSGAVILFGHLTDGCDPYWGQEYTMIVIDEVTRCIESETDYIELLGSLRSSHGVPCRVILTSNPGGQGHDWVRARFMNVPPLQVQKDKRGLERVFIPASLKNNPKLPEEYRYQLEQLPDAERKAFLDGNWDAFTGQVFDLVPGVHIVSWEQLNKLYGLPVGNKAIPKEWNRYRTYDHGYAHPGACYWHAMPPDGRLITYRELYTVAKDRDGRAIPNVGAKMAPQLVAESIKAYSEGETYSASWSGPDLFAQVRQDQAGGVTVATHFQAAGIHFTAWDASPGSRIAGKQALHARMHYETDGQGNVTTPPAFMVIEGTCPHLVRTLAALEYSEVTVELWDKTSEDHGADSLTGACKMRPWAPIKDTRTPAQKHRDTHAPKPTPGGWMAN